MTDDQQRAFDEWVATRPERVQVVLRKIDGWTAYRMASKPPEVGGLYILAAVEEPAHYPDAPCTVKMQRFDADTGMPMWVVFGMDPDDLVPVGPAINDNGLLRVGAIQ